MSTKTFTGLVKGLVPDQGESFDLADYLNQRDYLKLLQEAKRRLKEKGISIVFKYIHTPGYYLVFEVNCISETLNINDVGRSLNMLLSRKLVDGKVLFKCNFQHYLKSGVLITMRTLQPYALHGVMSRRSYVCPLGLKYLAFIFLKQVFKSTQPCTPWCRFLTLTLKPFRTWHTSSPCWASCLWLIKLTAVQWMTPRKRTCRTLELAHMVKESGWLMLVWKLLLPLILRCCSTSGIRYCPHAIRAF